jgi:hypothetical protein
MNFTTILENCYIIYLNNHTTQKYYFAIITIIVKSAQGVLNALNASKDDNFQNHILIHIHIRMLKAYLSS